MRVNRLTTTLEVFKNQVNIDLRLLGNMELVEVHPAIAHMIEMKAYELIKYVPVLEGDTIRMPRTWWDHAKDAFNRRWAGHLHRLGWRLLDVQWARYQAKEFFPENLRKFRPEEIGRGYVVWAEASFERPAYAMVHGAEDPYS